eukprot:4650787-Lingulodinium_polyedra.AAC.1
MPLQAGECNVGSIRRNPTRRGRNAGAPLARFGMNAGAALARRRRRPARFGAFWHSGRRSAGVTPAFD